jgi:hypothetical protein
MPGAQSRWSAGKDLSWEPLRIERVCEVKYDHCRATRFRHAAIFLRWRPDKPPPRAATTSSRSPRRTSSRTCSARAARFRSPSALTVVCRGSCRGGGLHARRFAGLLAVVRRPRRIAHARRRSYVPTVRAARRASTACVSIPACRSPIAAKRAGMVASVNASPGSQRRLVPGQRRRHPRVGRGHAPSRPRPRCDPSRSGCSRGTRRGAPPSTTCWWRARGARRSTSRASASAARRTSSKPQRRCDAHVDVDAA